MFPKRNMRRDKAGYETFRHSWILVQRTRPVVPCPENTPLPSRKHTKEQRAKILSVYLRPWTLVHQESSVDVPHLVDLDLAKEEWHRCKSKDQEGGVGSGEMGETGFVFTLLLRRGDGRLKVMAPTEIDFKTWVSALDVFVWHTRQKGGRQRLRLLMKQIQLHDGVPEYMSTA